MIIPEKRKYKTEKDDCNILMRKEEVRKQIFILGKIENL